MENNNGKVPMSHDLVLYEPANTPPRRGSRVRADLIHVWAFTLGVLLPALGFLTVPAVPIVAAVLGVPALPVAIIAALELAGYAAFVAWRTAE
jgi:hypothetical protein